MTGQRSDQTWCDTFGSSSVLNRTRSIGNDVPPRARWLLATAGVMLMLSWFRFARAQETATLVAVSPVVRREVVAEASFVATVNPLRRSVVGSAVDGRVVEFLAGGPESDSKITRIAKGQPLAKLRTGTIEIELAAARAELRLREYAFAELKNGSRPQEKSQALAKHLAAKARMDYTKAKYKRTKLLYEQRRTVSEEDLDLAVADAIEAEQSYRETKAQYDLVEEGPRQERIDQAETRKFAQREEVRRIEDMLAKYTIRAPFDGYVVAEHTEVGAWLTSGDPVAEVVQLDPVELEAFVPERYIVAIHVGMEVRISLDAIPGRIFQGRVERIISQADLRSRSFPVHIRTENPPHRDGHLLKAGMSARVSMSVGAPQQALLVPKDALVLGGRMPQIFVIRNAAETGGRQTTVQPLDVELGVADGNLIQVKGAVQEGEQVVVQGNERLRPGQVVRVTTVAVTGG